MTVELACILWNLVLYSTGLPKGFPMGDCCGLETEVDRVVGNPAGEGGIGCR